MHAVSLTLPTEHPGFEPAMKIATLKSVWEKLYDALTGATKLVVDSVFGYLLIAVVALILLLPALLIAVLAVVLLPVAWFSFLRLARRTVGEMEKLNQQIENVSIEGERMFAELDSWDFKEFRKLVDINVKLQNVLTEAWTEIEQSSAFWAMYFLNKLRPFQQSYLRLNGNLAKMLYSLDEQAPQGTLFQPRSEQSLWESRTEVYEYLA